MAKKDLILILEFDDKGTPKVKKVVKDVKGELSGLGKEAEKSGKGFNKLKKDVDKSAGGMSKFKSMMKSTAVQMAAGMGIMIGVQGAFRAVSRAITSTIQTGREFERGWANVRTMLDETQVNQERMRDSLLRMNPVLGDTTELTRGLYQVLSASVEPGLDGANALEFLGTAAKAAQAGVTDVATSVDALTTIMNAYGKGAYEVAQVSDIMFQTVKRGKLTYEGMAGAIGTVAPIAAQVGIRFEEVAAAMATLTRQGVDVNTTTVQLRQLMVSVLKPTSDAEKAAKRLGIQFDAATLKSMGLQKFLHMVMEAAGDDAEALTALFGNVRALTGVMGLAGKAASEFAGDLDLMNNAFVEGGQTEEAFRKQMESLDFWIKTISNAIKKFKIAIWEGLSKPFKENIKNSADFEKKMAELTNRLIDAGRDIGETIGRAIKFIIDFRKAIEYALKALLAFLAIKKIQQWSGVFNAAMVKAAAQSRMFGGAIGGAGRAASLAGKGISVVGAAVAGWQLGKAIDEATGFGKAMQKMIVGTYEVTGAQVEQTTAMAKLRAEIAGSELSIVKLKAKYGSYTAALEAVRNGTEELIRTNSGLSGTLDSLLKDFLAAKDSGELSGKALTSQAIKLVAEYQAAGKEIPQSLQNIIDAIDEEAAASKQAAKEQTEEWRKLVDKFKEIAPSMTILDKNFKAMTQAMDELKKEGADSSAVLLSFKDTIIKLYEEGKKAEEMYGKSMPSRLKELKARVDNLNVALPAASKNINAQTVSINTWDGAVRKASSLIGGIFVPAVMEGIKDLKEFGEAAEHLGVKTIPQMENSLKKSEEAFEQLKGQLTPDAAIRAIEDIISQYERLGKEVPEKYEILLKENEKASLKVADDWKKSLGFVGQLFTVLGDEISGSFGEIVNIIGLGIQQVSESIKQGVKGLGPILGSISGLVGQLGGKIGEMISGAKKSFASLGASIGSTIGGMFGPLGKAVGGLLGGLVGGLFKKKKKETPEEKAARELKAAVESVTGAMKKFGEISEDTAKKIAEADKSMTGFAAVSKYFGDVIRDVGVNQNNINDLWRRAGDITQHVTEGFLDAQSGAEALGDSFTQLIEGTRRMGKEGSAAMVEFINKVRDSGIEVREVTDYINEQLGITKTSSMNAAQGLEAIAQDTLPGLNKLLERQKALNDELKNVKEGTPEWDKLQEKLGDVNDRLNRMKTAVAEGRGPLANLESQAMSVFNAMIANGASYIEAMNSIGGTLDIIAQRHEALGTTAGAGIQELLKIRQVTQEHQGLFNAIEGNKAVLEALANTGSLTQQSFQDAARQTKGYYNRLMRAGLDSNQALAQMAPTLERLAFLQKEHGLKVDKTTQGLIDMAKEQGLIEEEQMSMQETMMAGFGMLLDALGVDIPEAMQKSVDKMHELEESMAGSGVVSALDKVKTAAVDTFGTMNTKVSSTFKLLGQGIDSAITGIRDLEKKVQKTNFKIPVSISRIEDKMEGGVISAQTGGTFRVTRDRQAFVAHRGEEVRVTTARETRSIDALLASLIESIQSSDVNVVIEPVVIPRETDHIIKFVVKKLERGDIRVPTTAVRGT